MKKFNQMMLGLLVGDAVGVPYEFRDRDKMDEFPCTDMIGYGTHNQPKGTWSDDSSMALCIVESIIEGYDDVKCAEKFVDWMTEGYMTPHGVCFDIGGTTRQSLWKMQNVLALDDPEETERVLQRCMIHNEPRLSGNGALMRILPFLVHIEGMGLNEQMTALKRQCQMTHQSYRSTYACFLVLRFAHYLDKSHEKFEAWKRAKQDFGLLLESGRHVYEYEDNEIMDYFDRIRFRKVEKMKREDIGSSGYVMDTLLASVWCILTSESYKEAVLKAVNLGDDTDTTAAVVGGLAGIVWGFDLFLGIPNDWIENLQQLEKIKGMIAAVNVKMQTT